MGVEGDDPAFLPMQHFPWQCWQWPQHWGTLTGVTKAACDPISAKQNKMASKLFNTAKVGH
jgi:hypothetical protein